MGLKEKERNNQPPTINTPKTPTPYIKTKYRSEMGYKGELYCKNTPYLSHLQSNLLLKWIALKGQKWSFLIVADNKRRHLQCVFLLLLEHKFICTIKR